MSSRDSVSYEPFRSHGGPEGSHTIDDTDTEKLIGPEPNERSFKLKPPIRHNKPSPSQPSRTRTIRIGLRVVALLFAISILGIQAWSAYKWVSTRNEFVFNPKTRLNTRAWAITDGWPTWTVIGAAVIATVIQLSALTSHLCVCVSLPPPAPSIIINSSPEPTYFIAKLTKTRTAREPPQLSPAHHSRQPNLHSPHNSLDSRHGLLQTRQPQRPPQENVGYLDLELSSTERQGEDPVEHAVYDAGELNNSLIKRNFCCLRLTLVKIIGIYLDSVDHRARH
jgi:hypothetical protein